MARLRYAKTLEQVKQAKEASPEFLESNVRSLRVEYDTDPALVAAVTPKPLEPVGGRVCVTFSHVAMKVTPDFTFEIGSAVFGVKARYDDHEGIYLLTMPMSAEQAVLEGRDTYGEPKKIGQIELAQDGDRVSARVTRMGITYLEASGRVGASLGPRTFTESGFCFKALPTCNTEAAFEADPLLTRLEWNHSHESVHQVEDGELALNESPFDPVADLPIRQLVRMELESGTTESNGRVLRSVPGDWLLPYFHQRYDDPTAQGIEV